MPLPKVVFVDRATIPEQIVFPELGFEHDWVEYDYTQPEQTYERVVDADIVITNKVVFDRSLLARLPKLKLIAVAATGVNNVDISTCKERNIAVTNVQGYSTRSVPEHVLGMIYALKRNLLGYHQDIADGVWQKDNQFCFFTHPIGDVADSTLAIIGGGALGQAVAILAQAVGMKVVFAERKNATTCRDGYVPFEQAIREADIVTLHCPLNDETRNLISKSELIAMKSSAILINTGRGGLVDEVALVEALKQSAIAGAGVDVFTQEPADKSNPLIANMAMPNLLLTPHVAWGSDSAITKLVSILFSNIEQFIQGNQQNRVV
ncbi:D-2-hydroxyacid dehydrogenase [Vibrio viridaestus]|uniref:D-2-hydroxyacid dehydrogenase n=1 Tax=Vibrio viridaestus TaxID=2487322 RepID=A0A3N9TBH7_9VIBR|nr:D-2-hydroxyacid dehydrogenase [Vibrio viridaestus]RQW61538.1 D-2-hydroxyacid dehydrogenase [Vibrio viridaestus]